MDEAIEWVKRDPEPDRRGGRDRDPPGVRGRGLRRRADARAARAGASGCAQQTRGAAGVAGARRRSRWRRVTSTATIDAVWRIESARLIAGLARMVRDVGVAEDLAQDALVAALEQWPESGVPDNPGAWLMATAKHRAIDRMRRADVLERKTRGARSRAGDRRPARRPRPRRRDRRRRRRRPAAADLHRLPPGAVDRGAGRADAAAAGRADDRGDRARLPGLGGRRSPSASCAPSARWPRRACRSRSPRATSWTARLASVLEVIYLIFNEGYSATAGDDWMRPALCEDALRLGRILAELLPAEPEVHGLVALMEIQASRTRARIGPRASRSCCSSRTARAGTGCSSAAAWRRSTGPQAHEGRARPVLAAGRDRRLPRPRARSRRRPTGSGSSRSTTRSPS